MTRRLLLAALAFAVTEVFFASAHSPLHPLQVGLLALLFGLLGGLLTDVDGSRHPWPRPGPTVTGGSVERRLATYTRMIENNQTADHPDAAVRDTLRRLANLRLQRHGLTYESPDATGLLGEQLRAALIGPPRRLRPREISSHLDRIEAL